jgi:hypothetical protein
MQPVTPVLPSEQPVLSRMQRRQNERAQRKLNSALMTSVSRLELTQQLAPLVTAGQQHEVILSFLVDRGLLVRDGRAVLDAEEFNAYLAEKNGEAQKAKEAAG